MTNFIEVPHAVWLVASYYLAGLGVILIYAFCVNRLRAASNGLRLDFAVRAETLILGGSLTQEQERTLRFALDNATNGWLPWLMVIVSPVFIVGSAFGLIGEPKPLPDRRLREFHGVTFAMWGLSVGCLSPICLVLLFLELVLGAILVFAFRGPGALLALPAYLARRSSGGGRLILAH
jgi:hypothetical protein